MNKNSMLYWYEERKTYLADVPQLWKYREDTGAYAETQIVPVDPGIVNILDGQDTLSQYAEEFDKAANHVGYPLFMRTDLYSGKRSWADTCYVEKDWRENIVRLIDESCMHDLPINAIVFRVYIEMATGFRAFNGMPVNPERRYFIRDGKVICHHPYWIPDAIEQGTVESNLPDDWQELLAEMNEETLEEILEIGGYARQIARDFFQEGYWSVDFCKGRDGKWYFIDMATGEMSWHPDDCPHKGR